MAQYDDTLQRMVGHIRSRKPSADPALIQDWINQRIRSVIDRRPYWSALLRQGIISIPAAYTTGTVSLTNASTTVTGSDTAWPTNDSVNTTVSSAITSPGVYSVTPGSMSGITEDSLLYVDASGTAEIVAVREVTSTSFTAEFKSAHSGSFTVTASSLAGRQLRMGSTYPTYTILAVTSATALTLDTAWGGSAVSDSSYSIVKMYHSIDPDIKDILLCTDPNQPAELAVHVSQAHLNSIDPQRSSSGDPYILADYVPSYGGNMLYEVYPIQTSVKQLSCLYSLQWPELKRPGDKPPWFLNPAMWIYGALADAFRTRSIADDPFYDPRAADDYEKKFEMAAIEAVNADNSKAQQAYEYNYRQIYGGGGANWAQAHAVSDGYVGRCDEDW